MNRIRIGLVDDHNLFRGGLQKLVVSDPELEVRIDSASGEDLLEKMTRSKVDVVLTDISMREMDGVEVARIITRDHKGTSVVGLSMHDHPTTIRKMIKAGARGYVLKSAEPPELFACIKQVHAGGRYFCNETTRILVNDLADAGPAKPANTLTDRELDVVKLIFNELSDLEIAGKLDLTQKSVAKIKKRIFHKLGVKNVVGLIKRIIEDHLL